MLLRKIRMWWKKRKTTKQNNYNSSHSQFDCMFNNYDDLMDKTSYASQMKTNTQHDRYTDDFSGMEP